MKFIISTNKIKSTNFFDIFVEVLCFTHAIQSLVSGGNR